MGAGALKRQAEEAEEGANAAWLPHYNDWEPAAMVLAYERWVASGRPAEVGRAVWFELFNEYTIIAPGGHFVSLDMDEFHRLSRYAPSRGANVSPTRIAFVMMALLGEGDPREKADVIFDMFAEDDTIGAAAMTPLMTMLVQALHVLGLTQKPKAKAAVGAELASTPISPRLNVDDIVKGCFDKDLTPLNREAFWLCWHNKRAIVVHAIEEFGAKGDGPNKRRRSTAPRKKRSEKRLDPQRSASRAGRAEKRFSVAAARGAREREHARLTETRALETGSYETTAAQRDADFSTYMTRVNKVASQKMLQELMDATGMDYSDLSMLRQEFAFALSNKVMPDKMDSRGRWRAPECARTMSLGRLKSVLLARFPALKDGRLLTRIARVFDADGDGVVDFVEFATGLARIIRPKARGIGEESAGNENLLEFIFSLFDKDQNGIVELWEICELVETAHDDLLDLHKYALQKTRSLDINGDGVISDAEFVESVNRDGVYRDLLWSSLPPVPAGITAGRIAPLARAMRAAAAERIADGSAANEDSAMVALIIELRTTLLIYSQSAGFFAVNFEKFWYEVVKIFGPAVEDHRGDALAIFKYFADLDSIAASATSAASAAAGAATAAEADLRCNVRKPWGVLARACAGPATRFKAQLLEALVNDETNAASSGIVTLGEITRFLDEMKKTAEELSTHAVKVLDELDASGDGKLDMSELKTVIFDNPTVLHCMSALQMYNNDPDASPVAAAASAPIK